MGGQIFVNLPVKDLGKTTEFFTNENATAMIIGKDSYVMLPAENFFKPFIPGEELIKIRRTGAGCILTVLRI